MKGTLERIWTIHREEVGGYGVKGGGGGEKTIDGQGAMYAIEIAICYGCLGTYI